MRSLQRAGLVAVLAAAGCGGGAAEPGPPTARTSAAPQHSPLLANEAIGSISADCSAGSYATFTFRADELTPGETVTATVGDRHIVRRNLDGDTRPLVIKAPLVKQQPGPGRFYVLTPVVSWTVFYSHEPAEVRARAEVRVSDRGDRVCETALARLEVASRTHQG